MVRRIDIAAGMCLMCLLVSACISVDTSQDGPNPGGDTGTLTSRETPDESEDDGLDALRADIERTAIGSVEYLVTDSDTLASIAVRVCGDASAWDDIFEANRGRLQPGGTPFEDPDALQPGWRLEIVCTAVAIADEIDGSGDVAAPSDSSDGEPTTYTVRSGDTLASIAVDRCGSEGAWLDIFDANQPLPDGTPFENENSLQAGWVIRIDCG